MLRLDGALTGSPDAMARQAAGLEGLGFSGAWVTETAHSPFVSLALCARATGLTLGTGVAIALARSPMTLAQESWDLAQLTGGRFVLGLGSQVKAHIVRRFSMPWESPVEQMREMVLALRAIWSAFQHRTPLKFEGRHYRLSLLTPIFSPEPMEHWRIPVLLAAVGPRMTELAGEVADGVYLHAFTHRRYLDQVTMPALERGLARSGRQRADLALVQPVFLITGEGAEREGMERAVRQQVAFYGSTPAYAEVLASLGQEELHRELHRLSKQGRWEEMARLVPEEVLDAVAVRAPIGELAGELRRRFDGVCDRLVAYSAFPGALQASLPTLVADVQRPG